MAEQNVFRANHQHLKKPKSAKVAFAFWLCLGLFGAHRFYLRKGGIGQFLLTVIGYLTATLMTGFVMMGIAAIWALIDVFFIPRWVRNYNFNWIENPTAQLFPR